MSGMPETKKGSGKHPVCWIDFLYKDSATSQKFYSELFGWKFAPFAENYFMFQPPKGVGGGFSSRVPEGAQEARSELVPGEAKPWATRSALTGWLRW